MNTHTEGLYQKSKFLTILKLFYVKGTRNSPDVCFKGELHLSWKTVIMLDYIF